MIKLHHMAMLLVTLLWVNQASAGLTVIAHRGASGYLPEHTLEAAALAFAQEPDYIEQDVVLSKDNHPVVLHDIHLETVSDVESKYPQRARKDGRFYAIDFTLAELKTLQVHERQKASGEPVFPARYQGSTAQFTIATLSEHIELITQLNRGLGKNIGFYTEIKSPAWHRKQGKDISKVVLNTFSESGLSQSDSRVFIQCFDFEEVKRIRNELNYQGKLVLLTADNSWKESGTDYNQILSEQGIREVKAVADGLGPWLGQLVDMNALAKGNVVPLPWLEKAKQAGLVVHPYTVRSDALPANMTLSQLIGLLNTVLSVDGVFTDQVPDVRAILDKPAS